MRLRHAAAGAALALCVSACGSGDDTTTDPPRLGDDSSSSATESSSEAPSETADAGDELAAEYADVELSFGSLPEVKGSQRDALAAYVTYEHGLRKLSRTAKINPELRKVAGEPLMPTLRNTVAYLRNNDLRYAGPTAIDVSVNGGNDRVVVLDLCTDASRLRLVKNGRKRPVEGLQRAKGRVTLNSGGTNAWKVTDYTTLEEPC
jgi:hypothetical protein